MLDEEKLIEEMRKKARDVARDRGILSKDVDDFISDCTFSFWKMLNAGKYNPVNEFQGSKFQWLFANRRAIDWLRVSERKHSRKHISLTDYDDGENETDESALAAFDEFEDIETHLEMQALLVDPNVSEIARRVAAGYKVHQTDLKALRAAYDAAQQPEVEQKPKTIIIDIRPFIRWIEKRKYGEVRYLQMAVDFLAIAN